MRLQPVATMTNANRWKHLVRHGLIGGSLVAAASSPAAAEPCGSRTDDTIIGFTLGVDVSPKAALIGGVEVRKCISDKSELMLRIELGGRGIRAIGGARARPFEDGSYDDSGEEKLGIEAGLAISLEGDFGAHLAGSYGYNYAYLALQSLFPLTTRANRPLQSRVSINAGFSPWSAFESQVVEGRPISVGGRFLTPDVIAQFAIARTAEDRAVRDHFTRSARFEYSSVWTFLRLAAELEAVGAPAHLIAAALDAADDEVRHAEMCAREAGGLQLAPLSMLAAQPRFTQRTPQSLAILAHEAWAEGCLNEGAAAEEARIASLEAQGSVRETLATIARDEATHAQLAWGVLAWIQSIAPAVMRDATTETPAIARVTEHDVALVRRGVPSEQITAAARSSAIHAATTRLRDLLA
ncbi:MAG: hypothetical protein ACKV2T_11930 [Kofleriaceae bacterium]